MATKRVRCRSGCVGWQDRLRNVYDNDMEQFLAYPAIYGIHGRLGYDSPEAAWDETYSSRDQPSHQTCERPSRKVQMAA